MNSEVIDEISLCGPRVTQILWCSNELRCSKNRIGGFYGSIVGRTEQSHDLARVIENELHPRI
jgi:hypothetical protein